MSHISCVPVMWRTAGSRTKGKLAVAFANLLGRMWKAGGGASAERPQSVKKLVGQVASRFIGYDQQDAQEFLHFFLDALHEDLNRIPSKPKYEEINDDDNATDAVRWPSVCGWSRVGGAMPLTCVCADSCHR